MHRTDTISIHLDGDAHGHRITLSAFQKTGEADADELYKAVAEDIPKPNGTPNRLRRAPISRDPSSPRLPRFPDNCTKPIKEDTVPFHAA